MLMGRNLSFIKIMKYIKLPEKYRKRYSEHPLSFVVPEFSPPFVWD